MNSSSLPSYVFLDQHKKWLMTLKLFFIFVFLPQLIVGCASITPYSLTSKELESYTRTAIRQFDNEQLQSGSPLSFKLQDIDIEIGPDGRDVIVLELDMEAALNALLMKVPATLYLKVEGEPFYDGKEKAVYIKRMALIDSRLESSFFNAEIDPVAKQAFGMVAQMLEHVPVYRLNGNNLAEQMLMTAPLNIKVVPGRIAFEIVSQK